MGIHKLKKFLGSSLMAYIVCGLACFYMINWPYVHFQRFVYLKDSYTRTQGKEPDRAIVFLDFYDRLIPNNPVLLKELAFNYLASGDVYYAKKTIERALYSSHDNVVLSGQLRDVYDQLK